MALPKLKHPLFPVVIPSTDQKTFFRPFTVKEEKILLIAKETKDISQVVLSIKQILNNCIQDIDVDKLSMFDVEYLFLQLRAKSVDNIIEFKIRDPDTKEETSIKLDIDAIEIKKNPKHTPKLDIGNGDIIMMKYPSIEEISILMTAQGENKAVKLYEVLDRCIASLVVGGELYDMGDYTKAEREEFIDDLPKEARDKIREFFDTMPVIRFEHKYVNSQGIEKTFVLEGIDSFFL